MSGPLVGAGHGRLPAQDHPHAFPQATEAGSAKCSNGEAAPDRKIRHRPPDGRDCRAQARWPARGTDDHDRWNAHARGEGPLQRADRAYGEILQEIRVAQTGVQILFAFLLTLAFTTRFRSITDAQRDMYVTTLMLCAAATALLIAPAACHRVVYRRRIKRFLVRVANRLALAGLVLLLLAMISALLLILDVVTGVTPALLLAAEAQRSAIRRDDDRHRRATRPSPGARPSGMTRVNRALLLISGRSPCCCGCGPGSWPPRCVAARPGPGAARCWSCWTARGRGFAAGGRPGPPGAPGRGRAGPYDLARRGQPVDLGPARRAADHHAARPDRRRQRPSGSRPVRAAGCWWWPATAAGPPSPALSGKRRTG
jgi:hypothetical protein